MKTVEQVKQEWQEKIRPEEDLILKEMRRLAVESLKKDGKIPLDYE